MPRPSSEVVSQTVDGGLVLVHSGSNRIYELNDSAAELWRALEAGGGAEAAIETLLVRYDVSRDVVEDEVASALEQLLDEGLLIDGDDGPPHPGE